MRPLKVGNGREGVKTAHFHSGFLWEVGRAVFKVLYALPRSLRREALQVCNL